MQISDETSASSPIPQQARACTDKIKQAVSMMLLTRSSYTGQNSAEIGAAQLDTRDQAAAVVRKGPGGGEWRKRERNRAPGYPGPCSLGLNLLGRDGQSISP